MNGDIHFEHINFTYEGQNPVLRDIDFTIPAGSTFAILGGTGSGKSTLMHLLDRLYDLPPECGRITVGGVDIAKMKRDWVRQNIGLVLQEPFLFSKTIVDNIRVFRPQASLSEVRNAAQIACVDDAVQEFSEGYDTVVGERGVTLSGGQKQRVAIARMLMQKAPIMVFDDSLLGGGFRDRFPDPPRSARVSRLLDGHPHLAPDHHPHAGGQDSGAGQRKNRPDGHPR